MPPQRHQNQMMDSTSDLEPQLRPEIDRLRARADELAEAVRERHAEALQAQADGDEPRAAALSAEVKRLNRRCNQANRAWLKLVLEARNAKPG